MVKDPFALLSIPAIVSETQADVVVVYRHPAAILASCRRMGWTAKLDAVTWAEGLVPNTREPSAEFSGVDEVDLLGRWWRALHRVLLKDIAQGASAHLFAHEELSLGGTSALRRVFDTIGLEWRGHENGASGTSGEVIPDRLHNLDRDPTQVARAWIQEVNDEDLARLDAIAGSTLEELERTRLPASGGSSGALGSV